MNDKLVALVRQAIFQVLDENGPRDTPGLQWDFNDDEERVDFADRVAAFLAQQHPSKQSERLREALHNMGTHSPAMLEVLGKHLSTAQAEEVLRLTGSPRRQRSGASTECSECPSGDCSDCPRKPARWAP